MGELASEKGEMTELFEQCHTIIRNNEGHEPFTAFEEMTKLVVGLFSWKNGASDRSAGDLELDRPSDQEAGDRRLESFKASLARLERLDSTGRAVAIEPELDLSDETARRVLETLSTASQDLFRRDVTARIFETFVWSTLRETLGIYLTPPGVVRMMVEAITPKIREASGSYQVLDPACGTGSFLLEIDAAYTRLRRRESRQAGQSELFDDTRRASGASAEDGGRDESLCHLELYGADINRRLAKITKLSLLAYTDVSTRVTSTDALRPFEETDSPVLRPECFDLVITNPPFGSYLSDDHPGFEQFETCKRASNRQVTELVFIERALELVKPGGVVSIVIPDSLLTTDTYTSLLDQLRQPFRLTSIVSLPGETFAPAGVNANTSVLCLEKAEQGAATDGHVLMGEVGNVGYDQTGRSKEGNELPEVGAELSRLYGRRDDPSAVDSSGYFYRASGVKRRDNWSPEGNDTTADGSGNRSWARLATVCDDLLRGRGPTSRDGFREVPGAFVLKVGNLTGAGIDWRVRDRQFCSVEMYEKRERRQLQKYDIVFTKDAHKRGYIAKKVDMVSWIPEWFDGRALAGSELMIIRPDREKIDPRMLLLYLRSEAGGGQIRQLVRGQTAHVYPDDVAEIEVPVEVGESRREELEAAIERLKESVDLWTRYQKNIRALSELHPFRTL